MAEEAELTRALPQIEEAAGEWRGLEERRVDVATKHQELEVRVAGVAERRRVLSERQAEVERRLGGTPRSGRRPPRAGGASSPRASRWPARGRRRRRARRVSRRLRGLARRLPGPGRRRAGGRRATGGAAPATGRRPSSASTPCASGPAPWSSRLQRGRPAHRGAHEHITRELGNRPDELVDLPCTRAPRGTRRRPPRRASSSASWPPSARSTRWPWRSCPSSRSATRSSRPRSRTCASARRELHEVIRTLDEEIMHVVRLGRRRRQRALLDADHHRSSPAARAACR